MHPVQSARTSPSTFLFLPSSRCQRTDPGALAGWRHWKLGFRKIGKNMTFPRLPGSKSALSEIAEQWERNSLGVVNVAGYSRGLSACQHPSRNSGPGRRPRDRCFAGPLRARLVSGGRYIWAPIFPVNTVSDQIGRVRKSKGSGRLTSAARLAYTKTRPACHMLVANRVRNRLIEREEPSLAAILDHSTLGVVR